MSHGTHDAVDVVMKVARERQARLVGVTGGIAAGKSTLAGAVASGLGAVLVSTDGFLFSNAALADAGLTNRKGFSESFDAVALRTFVDGWRATGEGRVPIYSHLHYDVVGVDDVSGPRLVLDGLHLGHPALGVRDRLDLLVHLDAAVDDLATWYLERFQELRTAAASDPTAFLYPFREMVPAVLDGMAMDVWRTLNLAVLDQEVRPYEAVADLVIRLGPDHEVVAVDEPSAS